MTNETQNPQAEEAAAMFRVFLTNFGHEIGDGFATLADARAFGTSRGFEFTVRQAGRVIGGWGVFSGWREF